MEELTGVAGGNPKELLVDPSAGRLYWMHGESFANMIRAADPDGSNADDIATTTGFMYRPTLDPDGAKIWLIAFPADRTAGAVGKWTSSAFAVSTSPTVPRADPMSGYPEKMRVRECA